MKSKLHSFLVFFWFLDTHLVLSFSSPSIDISFFSPPFKISYHPYSQLPAIVWTLIVSLKANDGIAQPCRMRQRARSKLANFRLQVKQSVSCTTNTLYLKHFISRLHSRHKPVLTQILQPTRGIYRKVPFPRARKTGDLYKARPMSYGSSLIIFFSVKRGHGAKWNIQATFRKPNQSSKNDHADRCKEKQQTFRVSYKYKPGSPTATKENRHYWLPKSCLWRHAGSAALAF